MIWRTCPFRLQQGVCGLPPRGLLEQPHLRPRQPRPLQRPPPALPHHPRRRGGRSEAVARPGVHGQAPTLGRPHQGVQACAVIFSLVPPTVSSLQICCRAVIRNYGNLLLSCGRFDEVVEWYDAMKDSPAVLASGAHGIAITACYRFVILNLLLMIFITRPIRHDATDSWG